jgi:hypothetical protein
MLIEKMDDQTKKIDDQTKKMDDQSKKLNVVIEQNNELKEDLAINQEILTDMNSKFDSATDERAPKTKSISKRDKFMIIKLNKPNYQWTYYAIRVQHASLRQTLKKLRIKYPQHTELITITYQPNGINFFNLMKEKLRNANKIFVNRNEIKLRADYNEIQFIQDVKDLDMSKKEVDSQESDSDLDNE